MTPPQFISTDTEAIAARLRTYYEAITGRPVLPSQAEQLIINMLAYEVGILRQQMQYAAQQMLLAFSNAPALDHLAELVGVTRLPATGASAVLRFTAATGHPGVVIPAGSRVRTADGTATFATDSALTIAVGATTGDVTASAENLGAEGNGYAPGALNSLLDPVAFVVSVANVGATATGSDAETDDALRARVRLATAAFSTAGSAASYRYHTFSADPSIVDVQVIRPEPGTVRVYPLTSAGLPTAPSVLAAVEAALNADTVIPLTDTVEVESPTAVSYNINVQLVGYSTADTSTLVADVQAALTDYANQRKRQIGQDVTRAQITALAASDNTRVLNAAVVSPAADVVVTDGQVATVGTITVTLTGLSNG